MLRTDKYVPPGLPFPRRLSTLGVQVNAKRPTLLGAGRFRVRPALAKLVVAWLDQQRFHIREVPKQQFVKVLEFDL